MTAAPMVPLITYLTGALGLVTIPYTLRMTHLLVNAEAGLERDVLPHASSTELRIGRAGARVADEWADVQLAL